MLKRNLTAVLIIFLFGSLLCAQSDRGSITGTVTDPAGAVVPGVAVTVLNVETGVSTAGQTNETGLYSVPNLPIGKYSVTFEKTGFKKLVRKGITMSATQVAELDVKLEIGAVSDSVTVTDDIPLLQTETADIGTNLKADAVNDLPLSIYGGGRFLENFAVAITPGYSPISSPYGAVVNGGQWFTKDFTIDGTSGTANIQGNSMSSGPSMEAVQEVQAQTSGIDSQNSITGGGVMSFSLKSGTNAFHGSVFNYGHNEILDANTWTNNSQGLPKGKARAWDYGFGIGGPIFKNKTFFFGALERYTQNDFRLGGGSATVPTTALMSGDFSSLLGGYMCHDTDGNLVTDCAQGAPGAIMVQNNAGQTLQARVGMIFDPVTGNQFTNNAIPSNRISSVSQKINKIYQESYKAFNSSLSNNNRQPMSNSPTQTPITASVKIDHLLSNKDQLSGSWIYNHRPRTLVDSGGVWAAGSSDGGPLSGAREDRYVSHEFRVKESHTFSPNLLNVFSYTFNWDKQSNLPSSYSNYAEQLGFGNTGAGNFPLIGFGEKVNGYETTYIGNTFQGDWSGAVAILGDTVNWTKGRHNFAFGGEFSAHQVNTHKGSGALSFDFSNNSTGAPNEDYAGYVGAGYASFLLGEVSNARETTPVNLYGRRKTLALFAQDTWKVRNNLTATLGLRWNYNFRFHEKYGNWANFDLNAIDPTYGIPGKLVYATGGGDSFEKNEYFTNFAPQLGLAYSPNSKLVFRGSIGVIYMPPTMPNFNGVPNGFDPGSQGTNQASNFNWDQGYPGKFVAGSKATDPTWLFPLTSVDPRALKVGYSATFNFGVQYSITPNTRLDVSYVGNRGHRLSDTSLAWNEGSSSEFLRLMKQFPSVAGNVYWNWTVCSEADAATYGIKYPYAGYCGPLLAAIAPYPQIAAQYSNAWFYPSMLYVGLPLGQSYYDSMVVDLAKRAGRGLTMDLSYTLSRQEGNTWSAQSENNGYYTGVQDFSNMGMSAHSLTGYDQTHVVKGYVSYELPFGKGRQFSFGNNKVLNHIAGGWTVAGTFMYFSGQPFMISAQNPFYPLWGNIYPNIDLSSFHGPSDPKHNEFYMPSSIATNPAYGTFGTSTGANSDLRCPSQANENLSVLKRVGFGSDEKYKLSLRAEFYNAFNRHYYYIQGCAGSRSTAGSADFGKVLGVMDNPRTGQFGLRLEF